MSIMNDKEKLSKIIVKSINYKNTLENLEMLSNGKNYKTLHKYIEKFKIDISHFESKSELLKRIKCTNIKYELKDILVKNFQGSINGNK